MASLVESHRLPHLEVRAPELPGETVGPLVDRASASAFRDWLIEPSGVKTPTVVAINLEGRFPSASVLNELVVPLGRMARSGSSGPLSIVLVTRDEGTRDVLRALAKAYDLALYWAPSADDLDQAEPLGSLTATDTETLHIVHRLGGRVTVSGFASAAGLEPNAASNRLVSAVRKGVLHRVERPRRHGILFVDPRIATPVEDPADPTSGDFLVAQAVRRDVKALTEMQIKEPGAALANAWHELLDTHKDELAKDHRELASALKEGDKEALARFSKRYAKKQANNPTSRRPLQ